MDEKTRLGLKLAAVRNQRGLTQEVLAAKIDRSVEGLSKIERGENFPQLETLMRLSAILAVPLRDFFDDLEPCPPTDAHRVTLEATLRDAARTLSQRDLEIAVDQVQAFARHANAQG